MTMTTFLDEVSMRVSAMSVDPLRALGLDKDNFSGWNVDVTVSVDEPPGGKKGVDCRVPSGSARCAR